MWENGRNPEHRREAKFHVYSRVPLIRNEPRQPLPYCLRAEPRQRHKSAGSYLLH